MMVRWCIFPGCSFFTSGSASGSFRDLEDHWVEQHGAVRSPKRKSVKPVPLELFVRDDYLRDKA